MELLGLVDRIAVINEIGVSSLPSLRQWGSMCCDFGVPDKFKTDGGPFLNFVRAVVAPADL
jgi:hypothetical protein